MPLEAVDKYADDVTVTWRSGGMASAKNPPPRLQIPDVEDQDIIVAQRVNAYQGLSLWRHWSSRRDLRTVYENDDDVFNITRENVAAYETFEEGGEAREAVLRYCSTANMITCTTPYLGDHHRELSYGVPVEVLPNYVPEFVLDLPRDEKSRPRLGWMGGGSHVRDVEWCANGVRRFMQRFPEWDLFINGQDYRRSFKVPENRSFHVPWVHITDDSKMYYRTIDFDIGICPLVDTKFARSKSPIKALEYSARGIPPVASDVEPYRNFIRHGETGFLVKQEHEWLKYLSVLASDTELRESMGKAAKEEARKHTIEQNWQKWVNVYKMLYPVGWEFKDGTVN